jgi:hypothetical protein
MLCNGHCSLHAAVYEDQEHHMSPTYASGISAVHAMSWLLHCQTKSCIHPAAPTHLKHLLLGSRVQQPIKLELQQQQQSCSHNVPPTHSHDKGLPCHATVAVTALCSCRVQTHVAAFASVSCCLLPPVDLTFIPLLGIRAAQLLRLCLPIAPVLSMAWAATGIVLFATSAARKHCSSESRAVKLLQLSAECIK